MFEQNKEEAQPRKSSRRETWCPGRSAWAPPMAGAYGGFNLVVGIVGSCVPLQHNKNLSTTRISVR